MAQVASRHDDEISHSSDETPLLAYSRSRDYDQDVTVAKNGLNLRNFGIAATMAVLLFLQGTNISGLTTIQGPVATDLNALSKASWLLSSYVIAASSTQPLFGRLCNIFSPRVCLFFSAVFFSSGTVISATAPSFEIFIVGRVVAGVGGGGMTSSIIILILELVSEQRRGLALGLVNTGYTVGVSLGAIIFGALLQAAGWRELFLAQAPLSLLAGICGLLIIPKSASSANDTRTTFELLKKIDYAGILTLTTAIVLFLVSLASTQIHIIPLILSIPFAAAFLLIEYKYAEDPIIPPSVLKSRGGIISCLSTMFLMVSRWGVLFFSPVYALAIREWPPSWAGTMLIPANSGFGIGGVIVGWLHIRKAQSYYVSTLVCLAFFASTSFILSQVSTPDVPVWVFMTVTFLNGLFTGAVLNYTLVHALHLTAASNAFIITSLMATFRGFGASFGSAIGGGVFGRGLASTYTTLRESYGLPFDADLLEQLLGSPGTVATLTGIDHEIAVQSYVAGLSRLFLFMGIVGVGAVIIQAGTGRNAPIENRTEERLD